MAETRVGFGYDAHRFGGTGPVVLCGVSIDHDRGVVGTSDADVGTHAVCDALLGSIADGDLGMHFPSSDPQWEDADSMVLLQHCVDRVGNAGFVVGAVDITLVVESVRVAPHREEMRRRIAQVLGVDMSKVSVKATTTDGLGWIGNDQGLAAQAVATVHS